MERLPQEILAIICSKLPFAEVWRLRRVSRLWHERAMATVLNRLSFSKQAAFRLTLAVNLVRLVGPGRYSSTYEAIPIDLRLKHHDASTGVFEFAPTQDLSYTKFTLHQDVLHTNIKGVLEWCESDGVSAQYKTRRNVTADNLVSQRQPTWDALNAEERRCDDAHRSFTFMRISRCSTEESTSSSLTVTIHEPVTQAHHLLGFHCDLKYSVNTDSSTNAVTFFIHYFRISETGLFSLASPHTKHLIHQRGLVPQESVERLLFEDNSTSLPWFDDGFDGDVPSAEMRSLKNLDRIMWIHSIQKSVIRTL